MQCIYSTCLKANYNTLPYAATLSLTRIPWIANFLRLLDCQLPSAPGEFVTGRETFLTNSLSLLLLSAVKQRAERQAAEVVRELAAEDGRRSCICASLDMGLPCASRTCHRSPRAQRPAQPPHPRPNITGKRKNSHASLGLECCWAACASSRGGKVCQAAITTAVGLSSQTSRNPLYNLHTSSSRPSPFCLGYNL